MSSSLNLGDYMELPTKEYLIKNLESKQELYLLEVENLEWQRDEAHKASIQLKNKIDKISEQLHSLNQENLSIKLSDYFTEEELREYNPQYEMLFEPELSLRDWLDWFYEELPFLDNKHLKFINCHTKKEVNFFDIPNSAIVKVDHLNQRILVDEYQIIIPSINIYKLLSVNTNGKEYETTQEEFY